MSLAGRVLDEDYLAGLDDAALTVARSEFDTGIEIHHVLGARRRMPVEFVLGHRLAKDGSCRGQRLGKLAVGLLFGPFDFDVPEVRFFVRIGLQVVNTHRPSMRVRC